MTDDDTETGDEEASAADEGRTVEDVDHEHPHTGETFDRTGVHGRGKEHPDSTDEESAEEAADEESAEEAADEESAEEAADEESAEEAADEESAEEATDDESTTGVSAADEDAS